MNCGAPPPGLCVPHIDTERTSGTLLLPSSSKPACAAVAMPAHPTKVWGACPPAPAPACTIKGLWCAPRVSSLAGPGSPTPGACVGGEEGWSTRSRLSRCAATGDPLAEASEVTRVVVAPPAALPCSCLCGMCRSSVDDGRVGTKLDHRRMKKCARKRPAFSSSSLCAAALSRLFKTLWDGSRSFEAASPSLEGLGLSGTDCSCLRVHVAERSAWTRKE